MSRVSTGLFEPVWIEGGPKSRAILQRPPDIDRPGQEFTYPSPTLRVPHGSLVQTRQVIRTPSGDRFLVADHSSTVDWVTHHLFRCDRQVTWARFQETTDPVTRLKVRAETPTELGTAWMMWERDRREFTDLTIRVDQETHLILTGLDVQMNDSLDGFNVKRVSRALGITVVELQG